MTGTLATPMVRVPLRLFPETRASSRSASHIIPFSGHRTSTTNTTCNASLHAVAEPESTTSRRIKQQQQQQPPSLYDVLRVKRNASPVEIKTAYRSLAKVYHPDAAAEFKEDGGRGFIEIRDAYATLSDPASRALYDLSLGVGLLGRRSFAGSVSGYYPTRRWETDQCW